MRVLTLAPAVAALLSLPAMASSQQRAALPPELPTKWEPPPGDGLEHAVAGFAKVLCAAVFITGRDLAAAAEEDGYFVTTAEERRQVRDTIVDRARRAVHVTLPNGVKRSARQFGDQGCIALPRGADSVFFKPIKVTSALPDPSAVPWPMGDATPDTPLPAEIDRAKLEQAIAAAFDPAGLTAAFVVTYKGRIVGERYGPGITRTTRLPSWSMGKSLTATLIGQLIQQGVYDLWAPAPVDEWQKPNDIRRTIRIADLLRMSSGLRFLAPQDPDFDRSRGYPDHLYVYTGAIDGHRWAITRPAQWPPNKVGRYRNSDPLTLNHLIKKAALARGEEYLSYPQRRLFDKLGMRSMTLETDPYGNFLLQGYELGTGRDWTRLALLYLQGGMVRRAHPAEQLHRFRANTGAGVVRTGVRRDVLAQPHQDVPDSGGRILHGRCRWSELHHHSNARHDRCAHRALQGSGGWRRRVAALARAIDAGGPASPSRVATTALVHRGLSTEHSSLFHADAGAKKTLAQSDRELYRGIGG